MPRHARGQVIDPNAVQTLHLVQRCVCKAWLCGNAPVTSQCFEHRTRRIAEARAGYVLARTPWACHQSDIFSVEVNSVPALVCSL